MMKMIGLGPKNYSARCVINNLGSLIGKFSVVLVGLGQISQGYDYDKKPSEKILTHAQALAADSHFKLLGGVDPCSRIRKNFETKFGCKAFASIEEAAFEAEVDVLVIATPTEAHWSAFELAMENFSPTAILCEKPLSINSIEAKQMVSLCEERGVKLFVNYIRRSDPAIQALKSKLMNREITYPFSGTCWYSGGMYNSASHFCDLFQFLFGEPKSWEARSIFKFGQNPSDPHADFNVEFENGCVDFKPVPNQKIFYNRFELVFSNCVVSYRQNGDLELYMQESRPSFDDRIFFSDTPVIISSHMSMYQKNVYMDFVSAINHEKTNLTTGEEALVWNDVFDALIQSA